MFNIYVIINYRSAVSVIGSYFYDNMFANFRSPPTPLHAADRRKVVDASVSGYRPNRSRAVRCVRALPVVAVRVPHRFYVVLVNLGGAVRPRFDGPSHTIEYGALVLPFGAWRASYR